MYTICLHIFIFAYEKILLEVNSMAFTNKNIYNTVRMNIKKYRKLKGMTQQELADASGYSHGYIREIESIKMASTFSLDAVERIANGLNIHFKLLFEETNEESKH